MKMTRTKKNILSHYHPDRLALTIRIIGPPPFDVYGISYLLHGPYGYKKPIRREAVRRTLELMVISKVLNKTFHHEIRNGMPCVVCRYGLANEVSFIG